jgi:glycerophosphoryl diester phosphodiesterase
MIGRVRPFLANPPLFFAHRGGAALWPENTLEAFRGALDLGIRHLETDVHATRDGVLVCHHDARVDRTTDGSGRVANLTLAELKRLDAGYRFSPDGRALPARARGITIPTLEEVVALHPESLLNVEIKQRVPDITESFWAFVAERGLEDRFLVAAEDHRIGRAFRKACASRVATSASRREAIAFWAASRATLASWLPLPYDALQVPERSGPLTIVDRRFVECAHRRGLHVHVWTVNDAMAMDRLLAMGVDGIMTDRPDLLPRRAA